jgi:deoxyribodipyrimidine photo-lyase
MSLAPLVLHWFRRDLRLDDQPALNNLPENARWLGLFVDETDPELRGMGGASRWWLDGSLGALSAAIAARGGALIVVRGPARTLIPRLARRLGASELRWNRRYGAAERALDSAIKAELRAEGIGAMSFNSHLLYEPMEIRSKAGGPMRVFTPFWKACLASRLPAAPWPAPSRLPGDGGAASLVTEQISLSALELKPSRPDWAGGLRAKWEPGEVGALRRLERFLSGGLAGYAEERNRPDLPSTSELSPHLAFGEISPRRIWATLETAHELGQTAGSTQDCDKFFAELGWREFSYHLLFHYPTLPTENYQARFNAFPWASDKSELRAWQKGLTGYPIVDAGMRQLWQTGFMHNRVRMIAASFLIKHLLIDWREGERWFWDTLCDADPANNAASWQWVAGSGADAAPYFRIFNPISQGEKFDPKGDFVRNFVPELARLPAAVIHRPWEASPVLLAQAGIRLGETYPRPIIAHDRARQRALEAFQSLPSVASNPI